MAALSDYTENKLLDVMLGKNDVAFPDINTAYVALFLSATDDAGNGTEVSGTDYARVAVGNDSGNNKWTTAAGGVKSNAAVITFPAAGDGWGTVTHVGIFDAASSGDLLVHGPLSAAKLITASDVFSFGIGDLQITLS